MLLTIAITGIAIIALLGLAVCINDIWMMRRHRSSAGETE